MGKQSNWSHSGMKLFRIQEAIPERKRNSARVRLEVEQLEDRTVPSTLDLTSPGAIGTFNGAIFEQANPQPTGPGVIHDFLRIQAHGASDTVEQGYNTDARSVQLDEKTDLTFTHAIQLSDLPTVTAGGVTYRAVLLGINQKNSSPLLSLDELRLYVANSPNLTGYDPATQQLAGQTAVYDMGANNWVELNASLSHGNGSGDMLLFVPDSVFTSSTSNPNPYVYLYSKFGVNFAANGGFEQSGACAGHGLCTASGQRRRLRILRFERRCLWSSWRRIDTHRHHRVRSSGHHDRHDRRGWVVPLRRAAPRNLHCHRDAARGLPSGSGQHRDSQWGNRRRDQWEQPVDRHLVEFRPSRHQLQFREFPTIQRWKLIAK